jgi:hypothetical protein
LWTYAFQASTGRLAERRFLVWLRDRLAARDVPALGPHEDAEAWALSIAADEGYVFIRLDAGRGGRCALTVDFAGAAEVEAEDAAAAVGAILSANPALRMVKAA